jgi:hypothetical protein
MADTIYGSSGDRFKTIELEINTVCDLACFGCDRFSDVASRKVPNMTLGQVRRFVDESLELSWEWERIRVLGGEPTLHPQFLEILAELVRYRETFPGVFLQVLSNSQGKYEKYRETCERLNISLHAEAKQRGVQPHWFRNTRIAPVDRDPNVGELPPCLIFGIRGCGIGLSRYGYFLDGAGASVARVAGLDIGVMSLHDMTFDAMYEQSKQICRLCGHWGPVDDPDPGIKVIKSGPVTGNFWAEKIAKWQESPPPMSVVYEEYS